MKKKIVSVICIIAMLTAMAPAMGAMAATEKVIMFDGDFTVNGSALTDKAANGTDITSGKFDSKMEFTELGGYAYAYSVPDSGRGDSLKLGIEESGSSPFFSVPIQSFQKSGEDGSLAFEFDYYINEKSIDTSDYTFSLAFYKAGNKTAIRWGETLKNNFQGTTFEYDAATWYKGRLELKWTPRNGKYNYEFAFKNGKYENSVCGDMVEIASGRTITNQSEMMQQIRIFIPTKVDGEKWIALDNVMIKQKIDDPKITGVEGTVTYDAQAVGINLSDKVYDISTEDVELQILDDEGESVGIVDISDVSFDDSENRITITPAESLLSMTKYKFVLKTTTKVDMVGATLSKEEEITFTTTEAPIVNIPIKESFEDVSISSSETTLDSGVVVSKGDGYAVIGEIDGEHSNSLKLGIGTSGTQMPHMDIPLSDVQVEGQSGNARIQFEYLIGVKPTYVGESIPVTWYSEGAFRLGSDASSDKKLLYWHSDMRNNYDTKEFEYETDTWYKVVLDLSWVPSGSNFNYTCTAQIKELGWSYKYTINNAFFTSISFFAPKTVNEEVWAMLDNITLSTQKPIPDIAGFEAFDDLDAFYAAEATAPAFVNVDMKNLVAVYLTETITGIDETLISLTKNGIDVPIEKAGYNSSKNAVLLQLTETLEDNTAYNFTLSADTEVWSGVPMGVKREKAFITSSDTVFIDVDSDDITISGDTATVNVTATNVADDAIKVYLIANIWDGNKFIGQSVTVQEVAATASEPVSVSVSGVEAGYTVNVYAWNNVFGAEMLTNKVVSKTNN